MIGDARSLARPLAVAAALTGGLAAGFAGCDEPSEDPAASTARVPDRPIAAAAPDRSDLAADGGTWGVAAYDALLEVRIDGEPLLFAIEPERWIDGPDAAALATRLEAAATVDPSALSPRARVALQNDVWGLWRRVTAVPTSTPTGARIATAAASLIRRLALEAPPAPAGVPGVVERLLPAEDGWRDTEAELPVFGHERLFGLRRLFSVRVRGDSERALYSTLVALDSAGRAHRTDVVGDLEVLRFFGDVLVEAHLFELDRRRLRRDGPLASMLEIDHAARVPGLGADGFLVELDPPVPLADLPCARCHDDAFAMTLPSDDLVPGRRHRSLLEQLEPQARDLGLAR